MTGAISRATAEQSLVRALTRQIGYTTGAFSILRMAELVSLFDDSTAYQFELVKLLQERGLEGKSLESTYASEILNFVTSLGLLTRLPNQGGAAHLARFALTDGAVAVRAAKENVHLRQLVLTDLVLQHDADAYVLTLKLLNEPVEDFPKAFREAVGKMRERRLAWLVEAIPNRVLLRRVTDQLFWVKRDRLGGPRADIPKSDFGRHHFSPRKTWAVELGHASSDGHLTTPGLQLVRRFASDSHANFWLAPTDDVLVALRLGSPADLAGPKEPALDMLRPPAVQEVAPPHDTVGKVADFMEETFSAIRLHHARQASLAAAKYFLRQLETQCGYRISWEETLAVLAKTHSSRFSFFTNRQGATAYYQLRKGA